jgi:hypothetical protein
MVNLQSNSGQSDYLIVLCLDFPVEVYFLVMMWAVARPSPLGGRKFGAFREGGCPVSSSFQTHSCLLFDLLQGSICQERRSVLVFFFGGIINHGQDTFRDRHVYPGSFC